MTDTSVVYLNSTMTGAPSLSGTAGALIGLLDACLADGFNSITLDSLVVADNVATATYSTSHGFTMAGNTGPVILIAGATPNGLNGRWRVTVISLTQFTFATSGISNQTASGTITAKCAPAGFSKAYSGTNKAAYQSDDITSTQFYWRIDDSTEQYASASAYETMSDIDTGTSFSTGKYVTKSNTSDATVRGWALVSDGKTVYLFVCDTTSGYYEGHYFGDFYAFVVDAYRALHAGTTSTSSRANSANPLRYCCDSSFNYSTYISGRITLARSYSGVSGGVNGSFVSCAGYRYFGYTNTSGNVYPSSVTTGMICDPIYLYQGSAAPDDSGLLRGLLRGLYAPHHRLTGNNGAVIVSGSRDYLRVTIGYPSGDSGAGTVAVDITGPWV